MAEEPSVLERHRRAVAGFDSVVDAAASDSAVWSRPTPCEGWTAADVVMHVAGVHHRVATELGSQCELPASKDPTELVAGWHRIRDAAVRTLAEPGALDTEIKMGPGVMKAGQFANILMTDTLVHTWDLARAVGASEQLDPELVKRAHEAAIPLEKMLRSGTAFGPAVAVDDDADPQTKMLAFFGRDPR